MPHLRSSFWLCFSLLALSLSAAAKPTAPAPDAPIVLILAGQSNMIGQGVRSDLLPAQRAMPPNVEFIEEGRKGPIALASSFGPELALAHELAAAFPHRKFRLLKFAVGTTSIRVWSPDWSEADARVTENESFGALYPRLLGFLQQHLRVDEPAPHAVLWFQGERDARFAAAAPDYGPRLARFVTRLRSDLRAPSSWFVHGVVNPPYAHTAEVVAAQRALSQQLPRVKLVESEGLTKRSDKLHYDTAGQWELGRRFAREIIATLSPPSPAG